MNRESSTLRPWLLAVIGLTGAAFWFAPATAVEPVRALIRDALRPGQSSLRAAVDHLQTTVASWRQRIAPGIDSLEEQHLREQLAAQQRRADRLQVDLAELRQQLTAARKNAALLSATEPSAPLYRTDLVAARILGTDAAAHWRTRPLLAVGSTLGVKESAMVLDHPAPLVDQGTDARLESDQPVFAADHPYVVGRIARVGRYSSTLCRITDSDYAGAARLVRQTPAGLQYGAAGTLVGEGGDHCRLLRVARTEPIETGDLVVTADTDGLIPPQIYGRVVRVNLPEGNLEWDVWVEPLAKNESDVLVLRTQINPDRLSP